MRITKMGMALLLLLISVTANASGYTNWAVPTEIVTTSDGLMVYGSFGNPAQCTHTYGVFVTAATTNHYDFVKSMILTAFTAGKQMQFFIGSCITGYNGYNLGEVYGNRHIRIKN